MNGKPAFLEHGQWLVDSFLLDLDKFDGASPSSSWIFMVSYFLESGQ